MRWRYWLIDGPEAITDVMLTVARLYLVSVLTITAVLAPLTVLAVLALWYVFGIRWGW